MVQSASPLIERYGRVLRILLFVAVVCITCWYAFGRMMVYQINQRRLPIDQVLQRVRVLLIYKAESGTPAIETLTSRKSQALLTLLRQSSPAPHGTQSRPDFYIFINCTTSTVVMHRYDYFLSTGEIGHGKEWRRVPQAFNDWMKTLKARPVHRIHSYTVYNDRGIPVVTAAPSQGQNQNLRRQNQNKG